MNQVLKTNEVIIKNKVFSIFRIKIEDRFFSGLIVDCKIGSPAWIVIFNRGAYLLSALELCLKENHYSTRFFFSIFRPSCFYLQSFKVG